MMHLIASDYEVKPIPLKDGREFIAAHHYSQGSSHTAVYIHGLFRKGQDVLLGAAQWLPPTRRAAETVNKCHWRRVLSLSRLAVHSDIPTNGASFLMGRSIRLIKSEAKWVSLVTYADDFMKHTGQIYKATNWQYVGFMKGAPRWEDENGKQVSKQSTRTRTNAEMIALGYKKIGVFGKHKFIMHLTNNSCNGAM